ncbi:MAG: FAD-dependent oxidoreductase, partial [Victivallales bacterium]|nr:FAD-dependent oxidoreductase [Victivallales bacterium]
LKRQPGFGNVSFALRSSECGCRESRRIESLQNVTAEDYRNGRRFPEMVCYSFYPLDLHDDHCGLSVERLREGVFPTVPRGALVPKEVRNLVVAGRLIGSDRLANSALRIQATCMATGQAAGALAALAAQRHQTPGEVDYALLRQTLIVQGAIL